MSYADKAAMVARFGEQELIGLTDRDGSLGEINDAVLNQALADANAMIEPYLGGRYDLPLSETPPVLIRIACDFARYCLYDEAMSEVVKQRHDEGLRFLERVAAGKVLLGGSGGNELPTEDNSAEIQSAGSIWSRDSSKGFI